MEIVQTISLFDLTHCIIYAVVLLLLSLLCYFLWRRFGHYKDEAESMEEIFQRNRLALILKTGDLRLWFYHPSSRHYFYLSEDGSKEERLNPVEFSQRFDRGDFEELSRQVFEICDGHVEKASVLLRSSQKEGEECRYYQVSVAVARIGRHHLPSLLMGIQHDVTDEYCRQQEVDRLLLRYHTVFNSSLLDMMFYDKNGVLTDINERACSTFHVTDQHQVLDGSFLLQNNPMFTQTPLDQLKGTRACSIIDFANYSDEVYKRDELNLHGKMYYESVINPIRNERGGLEGIYMSGRDISEMVESFHRQQEGTRQLQEATNSIEDYVSNINYALRVSEVRLVNYYPSSYTLEISNNIMQSQLRLSQLRCIRLGTPRFRRTISSVLNRMDHLTKHPIVQAIETEIRDKQGRQIWLLFNMVPMLDKEGNVERYFGMCRNITEVVETENRLAVETKKAQETELLKQAFLTNMSYEIRTPLNTVIGFAELFNAEHDSADEAFFVEQIKQGTQTLLVLISDILLISRLDANMEEYKREDVDFALLFESFCQHGMVQASPQVKAIIDHSYNSLVVDIDIDHVGKVIERLCRVSAMMTRQGAISATYEYRRGELTVTIEDTGGGIDPAVLPIAFERFSRDENGRMCGSGLDLPIIQLMVEQMGGSVDMQSEKGKGTTVWFSIPCTAKVQEKKREGVS